MSKDRFVASMEDFAYFDTQEELDKYTKKHIAEFDKMMAEVLPEDPPEKEKP